MTIETQIQSLQEEVDKKQSAIQEKETQINLLKESVNRDKKLLKIMSEGLESMKARAVKTEVK
jgi:peptidoglycan hydrolase CwlO-like protein